MVFFSNSTKVRRFSLLMYLSDVCTGPTFVLVRRLYYPKVCTVRPLKRPTLVSPTFVLVPRSKVYDIGVAKKWGLEYYSLWKKFKYSKN